MPGHAELVLVCLLSTSEEGVAVSSLSLTRRAVAPRAAHAAHPHPHAGMMENTTDPAGTPFDTQQLALELLDVRDIVVAANTSLANLVDCLANVPVRSAAGVAVRWCAGARGEVARRTGRLHTVRGGHAEAPADAFCARVSCCACRWPVRRWAARRAPWRPSRRRWAGQATRRASRS